MMKMSNIKFHLTQLYLSPYSRDGRQITFVLFLMDNIDQDGQNTNQNQMKNTFPFYIVFQVLKVLLGKICTLFKNFQNFIQHYLKKIFLSQIFHFLTNPLKPSSLHPLNSQNLLRVTQVFCQCSLKLISSSITNLAKYQLYILYIYTILQRWFNYFLRVNPWDFQQN